MKDNSSSTMGKKQDDESLNNSNTRTNTSPAHHKTPLTPTKDHPLMDLVNEKPSKGEFMDSDDSDEMVVVEEGGEKDDAVVDCYENIINENFEVENENVANNNIIENSQISLLTQSTEAGDISSITTHQLQQQQHVKNVEDEKNNNTQHRAAESNESGDDEIEKQQKLAVDKVIRRKKSPSRVTNNNIKNNNNRMSYPVSRDRSQPSEVTTTMTKSSDKIDGKKMAINLIN